MVWKAQGQPMRQSGRGFRTASNCQQCWRPTRTPGIEASGGLKEMRQEYRVPEITAWNESFCRIMQNELGHQNLEGVEHLL